MLNQQFALVCFSLVGRICSKMQLKLLIMYLINLDTLLIKNRLEAFLWVSFLISSVRWLAAWDMWRWAGRLKQQTSAERRAVGLEILSRHGQGQKSDWNRFCTGEMIGSGSSVFTRLRGSTWQRKRASFYISAGSNEIRGSTIYSCFNFYHTIGSLLVTWSWCNRDRM